MVEVRVREGFCTLFVVADVIDGRVEVVVVLRLLVFWRRLVSRWVGARGSSTWPGEKEKGSQLGCTCTVFFVGIPAVGCCWCRRWQWAWKLEDVELVLRSSWRKQDAITACQQQLCSD